MQHVTKIAAKLLADETTKSYSDKEARIAWNGIERSAYLFKAILDAAASASSALRQVMPNWESYRIPEHAYDCYDYLRTEADEMREDARKLQQRSVAFLAKMKESAERD